MLHCDKNTVYKRAITTDPVKLRVALLAADPPDNANLHAKYAAALR
jgi:hypothetical protein